MTLLELIESMETPEGVRLEPYDESVSALSVWQYYSPVKLLEKSGLTDDLAHPYSRERGFAEKSAFVYLRSVPEIQAWLAKAGVLPKVPLAHELSAILNETDGLEEKCRLVLAWQALAKPEVAARLEIESASVEEKKRSLIALSERFFGGSVEKALDDMLASALDLNVLCERGSFEKSLRFAGLVDERGVMASAKELAELFIEVRKPVTDFAVLAEKAGNASRAFSGYLAAHEKTSAGALCHIFALKKRLREEFGDTRPAAMLAERGMIFILHRKDCTGNPNDVLRAETSKLFNALDRKGVGIVVNGERRVVIQDFPEHFDAETEKEARRVIIEGIEDALKKPYFVEKKVKGPAPR